MPTLDPKQIEGALFLAGRNAALLADEPGFGKTAQSIAACDYVFAGSVLVVTTASARSNWLAEFQQWSVVPRKAVAVYGSKDTIADANLVVVGWPNIIQPKILAQLKARDWDVLILDEAHYAKSPVARRTHTAYSHLAAKAKHVWCLTGTPVPNGPNDLFTMLRALAPDTLADTPNYAAFLRRYCVTKPKRVGNQMIDVVIGGKNLDELNSKLKGFMLRRKMEGLPTMRYAVYSMRPDNLTSDLVRTEARIDADAILEAARVGDTRALEMHWGPLRRLTGVIKAHAVVDLIEDELSNGLQKIVLFAWHKEVIEILTRGLAPYGVVGIDGSTPGDKRQEAVTRFQTDSSCRVFVGQIMAAGEAITLTASNQCMFVETSLVPKDMAQAVRRILRRGQTRPCLCRVAALQGSVDEALMRLITRKVETIKLIMEE